MPPPALCNLFVPISLSATEGGERDSSAVLSFLPIPGDPQTPLLGRLVCGRTEPRVALEGAVPGLGSCLFCSPYCRPGPYPRLKSHDPGTLLLDHPPPVKVL